MKLHHAEVNVLDRIMYMLEEQSVAHLVQEDHNFAEFIDELYGIVHDKANALQNTAL